MDLFPATTVADVTTAVTGVITDNGAVLVGLTGLAVAIRFGMGWFRKATNRIKA